MDSIIEIQGVRYGIKNSLINIHRHDCKNVQFYQVYLVVFERIEFSDGSDWVFCRINILVIFSLVIPPNTNMAYSV